MNATIHYIRPGKGLSLYVEDFVSEDETCLRTFKSLPPDIVERLSAALQRDGLIGPGQRVQTIAKVYFFDRPFNLLEFRDTEGILLGHYSDIGEPATRRADGDYEMVDLFLDIWLAPDGTLLELDWDELEEAIQHNVINAGQAQVARAAMQRLKDEVAAGIYPAQYL